MKSWPVPVVPSSATFFSADALAKLPEIQLFDTADQEIRPVDTSASKVGMYVCGITPYDSTHLGHAATYLTFDLVYRLLLASAKQVHYVQNITDVDDPLFERAARDGVDWRELGTSQIDLFRSDMTNLSVLPPQDYIGAMESVPEVIEMVQALLDSGAAYQLYDDEYPDIYARIDATEQFGYESNYDRATMEALFAERGGDPERPGKRDPLDALLWRAARPGEPAWDAPFGAGRPGWHIECSAIATQRLGASFAIQGGGSDLQFPHHEYSAAHAEAKHGTQRMAGHYVHTGMIGLEGTKMSKSLGNLVFVSKLTAAGHEPSAIRLGVYAGHYRENRDWSDAVLSAAEARLGKWRAAADTATDATSVEALLLEVFTHLATDLDTPRALAAIDAWADAQLSSAAVADASADAEGGSGAAKLLSSGLDALLGVRL